MSERIRDEIVLKLDHVTTRFGGLTDVGDVTFGIMIVRPKGLMGGKELPVGRFFNWIKSLFVKKDGKLPPADNGGKEASAQ